MNVEYEEFEGIEDIFPYLQKIKKLIFNSDYQKTGQTLYDNPPKNTPQTINNLCMKVH